MRIGIAVMRSQLGGGGGVAVYTREILEALASHSRGQHTYFALIHADCADGWDYRHWPDHIQFVPLQPVRPFRSIPVRAKYSIRRLLGLSVPLHYGEMYMTRQIDALKLNILHYPQTIIWPLSINVPCVLTFFDMQHEYYPQFFTQIELDHRAETYRPSVNKAHHLIVPSDYTQQSLMEKYDVPPHKMTLIPVGIADTFRRADPIEVEGIKEKYGLPDTFIFYPANPWQHKNHARLMAALRIYRERYEDAPYLVVSGRLREERRDVLSLAIAAGVEDKVLELGFVPTAELPALYSAAKLLVFPSLFEGFGMPLVEAMACGCPIAAADATTIPEITNGAALLFDPFDPDAIAEAIHNLLVDSDLCKMLVRKGYERAEAFQWAKIVPQIEQVYERVLDDL